MTPVLLDSLLGWLADRYTLWFGLIVSLIGLWAVFVDCRRLEQLNFVKEAKFYRALGIIYGIGGIGGSAAVNHWLG